MPLISVLGRQRQADLCEFEASVFYRATSRTARAIQKLPKKKGGGGDGLLWRQGSHYYCPGWPFFFFSSSSQDRFLCVGSPGYPVTHSVDQVGLGLTLPSVLGLKMCSTTATTATTTTTWPSRLVLMLLEC